MPRNGLVELPGSPLSLTPRMDDLRLVYIDPGQLAQHPSNWRTHPAEQRQAAREVIAQVGWAGVILYNERTQRILDGHMRAQEFKGQPCPVLIGDWSEEQEKKILATHDTLGLMAGADAAKIDELVRAAQIEGEQASRLAEEVVKAALADAEAALRASAPKTKGTDGTETDGSHETTEEDGGDPEDTPTPPSAPSAGDVPDALWESDNPWGVPTLRMELAADAVDFPVTTWGTIGAGREMRGTYHFYTRDSRFDPLWANPAKVLKSGCPSIVEPNFSTHEQTPFSVALWAIFRKRWLARWWQSKGLRVLVDLNVHHALLEAHPATAGERPNFLGVPRGWPAYATRSHGGAASPDFLDREYAAAAEHSGLDRIPLFLVIGGGRAVEALCGARGWVWVAEQSQTARAGRSKP
jgi:hypothetical protein